MKFERKLIQAENSICFCTVSMNRLNHLRETLPVNIDHNIKYNNVKFVILDYNSTDGLEDWVKENLLSHIEAGKLEYYRTVVPKYFHRSHSRNMVFKLAGGDLLCNIDADNFTGIGFANYLNSFFTENTGIFLTAQNPSGKQLQKDVLGRIAVRSVDFHSIRGYDEFMKGYGYEDHDFICRLEKLKLKRIVIDRYEYLMALRHEDSLRICNEYSMRNIHSILVRYINPSISDVVLLFEDGQFEKGTIINNTTLYSETPAFSVKAKASSFEFQIAQFDWIKGNWIKEKQYDIVLSGSNKPNERLCFNSAKNCYFYSDNPSEKCLYEFTDPKISEEILFFHSQISNRIKLMKNQRSDSPIVNGASFGSGIVYKNFNYSSPIFI